MAINPIVFTEKVVRSFLRYQLTAYPFADKDLHTQMRQLLSLDQTRQSPLLKGPYVSLSRPFRQGAKVDDLIAEGIFHPHMRQRIPDTITHVYGHQEEAIRAICSGRTTLVSTGTGSGKTECFLYPIVSKCLQLRDANEPSGISAVIVYPMNALAEDQLSRLRSLLAGTGIPFGMYVGKTPEYESRVAGIQLPAGASRADYEARLAQVRREKRSETVHPAEEVCSREMMRKAGKQPRILLTNVKQLELLLTRQRDVELFADARLDFLVFDEAHTFTGAQGAETACLIRRLRTFCGRKEQDTVCVATSATIVDKELPDAAREFASRFFGIDKAKVTTVGEAYEPEVWAPDRYVTPPPSKDAGEILAACVEAVEDETGTAVQEAYRVLSGRKLPEGEWAEVLHAELSKNELLFQLSESLVEPRTLAELPPELEGVLGRPVSEAELLSWLTLGAAARHHGRPLLRPVVHGFIRGISGAVVSFPASSEGPKLWLAAEDEVDAGAGGEKCAHFPVATCTTCGQHYFVSFLKDFQYTGNKPGGGEADGESHYWEPLEESQGGKRLVLIDHLVGGSDDEELDEHNRTEKLFFCRRCGAAHPVPVINCAHCGAAEEPVELYAIQQRENNPGYLTSCLSCGAIGRRYGSYYREPARAVRATNVADVHVLAQDMVHHSDRQRLLVFCDNRQDAAFQAGWMKDHARRFRLRALMANGLKGGAQSIGDLARYVDDLLEKDEALSRALVPEVWLVARKEGGGGRHEQERLKFLRIQVLREVALSSRQAIGLEPWGRLKVEYKGLQATLPWIQNSAHQLGMPPEDLRDGVAGLLDYLRRKRILYDPEQEIFTRYWMDGDLEVQAGYLPQMGNPVGTKLRRESNEKPQLVTQWLSDHGDTTIRQMARKWNVAAEETEVFIEGLFKFLIDQKFIVPVRLKGARGQALPNVSEVYQVDADRLRLQQNHGVWRCRSCRRRSTRRTPHNACLAWRCTGELEYVREDSDNYDLQLLDQGYSMLRPEEHTAMVPSDERERLENLFKGDSDAVNAFVCTPTLELGVDIGQLDAVLMRNVPPLPANYWQRAGRAGRRHRMAVDLTYCRPVSHDRAYFAAPLKLLTGRVDPPAFNLRNELMVAKHVHATVVTRLYQYARDPARAEEDRIGIEEILNSCIPARVSSYLFLDGAIRTSPFDLHPLESLIARNNEDLVAYVQKAFQQGWPVADSEVVSPEALKAHVSNTTRELDAVISRLDRRLKWAVAQIKRLNEIRERQGTLEKDDEALFRRCDALVKRLKGVVTRSRSEAEGYDDVNTYGVLSAEGFLPGYGLEIGSILGTAVVPYWRTGSREFYLPRPPSVALREYIPGNLIYANGNRFVARRFHRDIDEQRAEMPVFEVSTERQAVKEIAAGATPSALGATALQTISVCDVDLVHQSHISDEEELRFQLGVTVHGLERDQHNGGKAYHWGERSLHHRRGVRLRLVNVGASGAIARFDRFGYPICTVCGQSVSPLSSDRQRTHFDESHQERCNRPPTAVGFYADIIADVLSLPGCSDQSTAYSVLEALRFATTRVLDMHMDDLQILVIGHVDRDEVDALLWDPMPGGSGLIDQMCERFEEIVTVAKQVVTDCPSLCETSCIDCLQTFRNGYYHKHLYRKRALECLDEWGPRLHFSHTIPPKQPSKEPGEGTYPVNEAERKLRSLLLSAGFEEGIRGEQIKLDRAIGTTTPDVIYRAAHHDDDEGICIYLDGLSDHLHGNSATAKGDQLIRTWMRNNGFEVIEIAVSDLDDEGAMTRHFRKLAGYLRKDKIRDSLRDDNSWFARASKEDQPQDKAEAKEAKIIRLIVPKEEDKYVTCVPLFSLEAAAGAFSDGQTPEVLGWADIDQGRKLRKGMFVGQVVGKSMEPMIPDGSYCLFSSPVEGSRQGRIVLAQHHSLSDPEHGGRYTVKRYKSKKTVNPDETWEHTEVVLEPLNKEFQPIVFEQNAGELMIIAEFLEVLSESTN